MIAVAKTERNDAARNAKFEQLLPQIERQAALAFRSERPERREELISEVIANAFVAFTRLVERGREDLAYPTVLARYAVSQVRDGRRVGTKLNVRDISSEYSQRNKGVKVERLDRYNRRRFEWKEVLVEDRRATPADLAACRIDFADWLKTLSTKQRQAAELLATGETTGRVAELLELSAARISQLRRELKSAWERFQGVIAGRERTAASTL